MVGGDLQDVHRLLSVWLRQLVYDVQQLLQLGLKHLKAEKVIMITIAVENKWSPLERPPFLPDPSWPSRGLLKS